MKKIALIEDDALLSKRLALFLNRQRGYSCEIVADTLGSFFEQLTDEKRPGLLLVDVELSNTVNTIDHLKKIKALLPDCKIIIITGHNHPDYIRKALQNGADSFYLKGSGLQKLTEAIDTTLAGGAYLAPEAASHLMPIIRQHRSSLDSHETKSKPDSDNMPQLLNLLTERELQVARGLASGVSYKKISEACHISVNTVRHYVKRLYKKFDVSNKVEFSNKVKPHL